MKLTLLPSVVGEAINPVPQYLSCAVINDCIALDAGSLGFSGTPQEQSRIRHVVLTHSHIDHIASLPIFLENVYQDGTECVSIYASGATLESLRRDFFNDRIWPDFVALSKVERPFMRLVPLEEGQTIELEGLQITAVALDHVVPVLGFIVRDVRASVVFATDTGPTDAIWRQANALSDLKAVFLEVTFPDELDWLAEASKHLTPAKFARELNKLKHPVRVLAMHLKARHLPAVIAQVEALGIETVELAQFGVSYAF